MITYILWGACSFFALLALFMVMIPNKEKIEQAAWYIKWPLLVVFFFGYIADIIWNYVFGSTGNYILDRLSGYDHKRAVFLPVLLEKLTWKKSYLLTFTYRLKMAKLTNRKKDLSYRVADYICHKWLDRADPGHCSIDKYLRALGERL